MCVRAREGEEEIDTTRQQHTRTLTGNPCTGRRGEGCWSAHFLAGDAAARAEEEADTSKRAGRNDFEEAKDNEYHAVRLSDEDRQLKYLVTQIK